MLPKSIFGKEIKGIRNIEFSHSRYQNDHLPVLKIELLADKLTIDTAQVFRIPEAYYPYYISSNALIEAGILTLDELNKLMNEHDLLS